MVSEKTKDDEMQETARQLNDCVKAQVEKLQNRIAAEAHPVFYLPIVQHLLFATNNLAPVIEALVSYASHRFKERAAVTKWPFLVGAVKLFEGSAAH